MCAEEAGPTLLQSNMLDYVEQPNRSTVWQIHLETTNYLELLHDIWNR